MNKRLEGYARKLLKEDLVQCTEKQQQIFKEMYSPFAQLLSIDQIVDKMPVEKLDWALQQTENTLKKKKDGS